MFHPKIGSIVVINSEISGYHGMLATVINVNRNEARVLLNVDGCDYSMWFFYDEIE